MKQALLFSDSAVAMGTVAQARICRRDGLCLLLGILALPLQAAPLDRDMPLAQALVAGSPWVFRTRYEETYHHFRFNEAGALEWMRAPKSQEGNWQTAESSDGRRLTQTTINGHLITIEFDKAGQVTAQHSKHSATFRRVQD